MKSSEEIAQYIQSYKGFVGVTVIYHTKYSLKLKSIIKEKKKDFIFISIFIYIYLWATLHTRITSGNGSWEPYGMAGFKLKSVGLMQSKCTINPASLKF